MRGKTHWNEKPHLSPFDDPMAVYICRLAPDDTSVQVEWTDAKQEGKYILQWRGMFMGEPWNSREVEGYEAYIDGLTTWRDYEVRVARINGEVGRSRYFRVAKAPGTVINYLHPQDDRYAFSGRALCSPNLIKLPSGKLLASMDVYLGESSQTLTLLFKSEDRGETWHYICDMYPLFWGKTFYHKGRLYMLGCSTEFGDYVIGASDDEGETWTAPVHLFAGSSPICDGWEQTPMPVITYKGRLYSTGNYVIAETRTRYPCVLSVDENADLLDPGNWSVSKPYRHDTGALNIPGSFLESTIEGNLYVAPEGDLRCMLRVDAMGVNVLEGKAAVMKVNTEDPDAPLEFSHFVSMPLGYNSKFMMRYDEVSGYYVAIGNLPTENRNGHNRKVLAMAYSKDSENWKLACRLLDSEIEQWFEVGYQYPSYVIDGEDILFQLRTATNGAQNFHNANYSTFHTIPRFRELLK